MIFTLLLVYFAIAVFQIGATTAGPASWSITKVILILVDVNSRDVSIQRRAELWVTLSDPSGRMTTQCVLKTHFPVTPDEWNFCTGGEFYIRTLGLYNSSRIEFDLEVARMSSKW
jgi:hypothetical protein